MFNDKYGLQRAAIDGTKPMTRRSVPDKWQQTLTEIFEDCNYDYSEFWKLSDVQYIMYEKAPYKVGEIVAIAQSYKDLGFHGDEIWRDPKHLVNNGRLDSSPGWDNKMFVRAAACTNRIIFTANKIERLQDISDEDCLLEGIKKHGFMTYHWVAIKSLYEKSYRTPRDAFAALIDKVSGRGTWKRNPWVFAYSFELVK